MVFLHNAVMSGLNDQISEIKSQPLVADSTHPTRDSKLFPSGCGFARGDASTAWVF